MDTPNLLRPNQIEELKDEEYALKRKLQMADVMPVDRGAVQGQLRRVQRHLEVQSPKDVEGKEKDDLIKETDTLLTKILEGMPSQEEMRKNPPGAVDKHRKWEKRNKAAIVRWKNNILTINKGTEDTDIANLEKYRPRASTLNMDNAQIPGTDYFFPAGHIAINNVASEEDRQAAEATKFKLTKQALDTDDYDLAKFVGVDLDVLKAEMTKSVPAKKQRGRPKAAPDLDKEFKDVGDD